MPLSWSDIRDRAVRFVKEHARDESEHAQSQLFWRDFLDVFGVPAARVGAYEHHVRMVRKDSIKNGRIDLFWPGKLLVEMKSAGKDLDRAFNQALEYFDHLPARDLPRYILVSDFREFRLHDMELGAQWAFSLKQLPDKIKLFAFIPGYEAPSEKPEIEANIRAAHRMGRLFEALEESGYGKLRDGHDLRVLMVRLLFCLFADDTGIFQPSGSFKELLDRTETPSDVGRRLIELFEVLNTPEKDRQAGWRQDYDAFRYINGRLFEEPIRVPVFDATARDLLLEAAAINWSHISPAIFGSLFQSIKDRAERRRLGEHYTSEENILKLIKPLFLDDLWEEFERVKRQRTRLAEFHKKLRSLTFLDPACGCGNFLVIAYRELRRLELQVLRASNAGGQQALDVHILSQVDVDQFYGIEVEEFPAQIAQVALWLTDHQMNRALTEEFGKYFERLPLVTQPHIMRANALRTDWAELLPPARCSFILGNPPFVGAKFMDDAQRADTRAVFAGVENAGLLDLVAAWYVKAARYMRAAPDAPPRAALVSTNSITQGEQVGVLWSWLLAQGIKIHFAHRTFKWGNEASGKAAVHCVIIGFGLNGTKEAVLFDYSDVSASPTRAVVSEISPYLIEGPPRLLGRPSTPICQVPPMRSGNKPIDDGNYLFTPEEKRAFLKGEPKAAKYFKRWLGGEEFINNIERWCLWLGDCPPAELKAMPEVVKRVAAVRKFRSDSASLPTQKLAATPTRFHTEFVPDKPYLAMAQVSSERRHYIPIAFLGPDVLCGDKLRVVENATLFHFGVMTSTMHMAWTRQVCGRLESRYQYSVNIVYNNFPWPEITNSSEQGAAAIKARDAIEVWARAVLVVRESHQEGPKGASLADLYDPATMPPDLLKAHQKLDAAVDAAYVLCGGKKAWKTEAERVAFLFDLHQRYTSILPTAAAAKPRKKPSK